MIKYKNTKYGNFQFPETDNLIYNACNETSMFEDYFVNSYIKQFMDTKSMYRTLIDVGSHVGTVACQLMDMLKPQNTICFEMNPEFVPMLTHNLKTANLGEAVVQNVALANTSGAVGIKTPNRSNTGDTRIGGTGSIALKTLDSFNYPDVDFLKVDAQGTDSYVILGALQTILKHKPLIWAEVDTTTPDQIDLLGPCKSIQSILEPLDYTIIRYGLQLLAVPHLVCK